MSNTIIRGKAASCPKSSTKEDRTPSPYNSFMKEEIQRLKDIFPDLTHKDAFKMGAANWRTSEENPRNV